MHRFGNENGNVTATMNSLLKKYSLASSALRKNEKSYKSINFRLWSLHMKEQQQTQKRK